MRWKTPQENANYTLYSRRSQRPSRGTDRVVWLADAHTCHIAEELQQQCTVASHTIVVGAGDDHKNIETLVNVWQELQQAGATRHSLLINVGGGMVTDLGGFAAATFKRGIRFVNVPTTLLAMIDDRHQFWRI